MSEPIKIIRGDQVTRKSDGVILTILGDVKMVQFPDADSVMMLIAHDGSNLPYPVTVPNGDLIQTGGVGNILLVDDQGYCHLIRRSEFEDDKFERIGETEDIPILRSERKHA